MIIDRCDEDSSSTQGFIWKNMQTYEGQEENFMGSAGPQGAAKYVTEIVDIFNNFSIKNNLTRLSEKQIYTRSSPNSVINYQSVCMPGHGNL
jgi:hypothetical protein